MNFTIAIALASWLHQFHQLMIDRYSEYHSVSTTSVAIVLNMKRSTVTLPDYLAKALDAYVAAQEVPPSTTAVVQDEKLRREK